MASRGDSSFIIEGWGSYPLGPILVVSISGGGGWGDLSAANPGPPGFRALKRLTSFSLSSCVLLLGRGFEANFLLCIISLFLFFGMRKGWT